MMLGDTFAGHPLAKWFELLEAAHDALREWGWDDRPLGGYSDQERRLFNAVRAFDPPKPKRHTFGGVVYEETGEVRRALDDEWFVSAHLAQGQVYRFVPKHGPSIGAVMILRPVAVEAEDAD